MVVRSGVRDREPDGHRVEESLAREVRPDMEHELIGSGPQARSLEERRVGAPVAVRGRLRNQRAGPVLETVELDRDAGAGLAARESVVAEMERRAGNDSTTELKNAFEQIGHITRGRLEKIIDG